MNTIQFQQKSWNLKDVLLSHSGSEFDAELKKLKGDVKQFGSMKGTLSPQISVDDVVRAFRSYETIQENVARFRWYSYMLFSQDTSSQEARSLKSQIDELHADVKNKTLFFEHWLTKLDDETHDRLMRNLDRDFRYYVQKLRKKKPHILDEKEETIINIKDTTGVNALVQLYTQITSGFQFVVRIDGKTRRLTDTEITKLMFSPNPKEREAAYRAFNRKYAKNADVLGEIYIATMRNWNNENLKLRQYPSPISVFNLKNDIPDEVADVILSTCRKNCDVFRNFFSIKARLLGMKKMSRYHIYAPLQKSEKKIPYADAVDLVLDSFSSFDARMGRLARKMFEQDHVDSEIRKNKMFGAYCMWVTPKIMHACKSSSHSLQKNMDIKPDEVNTKYLVVQSPNEKCFKLCFSPSRLVKFKVAHYND